MKIPYEPIARIVAKTSLKYILLLGLGVFLSFISIIVSFIMLGYDSHHAGDTGLGHAAAHVGGGGGGAAGILILFMWFATDFWSACLFWASILFLPLYFIVANKYAISYAIHQVWKNQLSGWVIEKTDGFLTHFQNVQPEWIKNTSDKAAVKMKMIESINADKTTPKIQRKMLTYLFKKTNLNDVDFQKDNFSWKDVMLNKFKTSIQTIGKPSMAFFGIVIMLHVAIMILAIVM